MAIDHVVCGHKDEDTDPELSLSLSQLRLHDGIDFAVETADGFGGFHCTFPRMGMTTALVMYAKKHDAVALEVQGLDQCRWLETKYPFLGGRVHVHWRTPVSSTATIILVDCVPPSPPVSSTRGNGIDWCYAPRFVAFRPRTTLHLQEEDAGAGETTDAGPPAGNPRTLTPQQMLSTYIRNCASFTDRDGPEMDELVRVWFAYYTASGRSAKVAGRH